MRPSIGIAVLASVAVLLATAGPSHADATQTVRGRVVDDVTGTPIAGAFVTAGAGEIEAIGESDREGHFALPGLPRGEIALVVVAADRPPMTLLLAPGSGSITVRLAAARAGGGETIQIQGKVVDDGRPPAYGLDADEVSRVPGAAGDPLKSIQSLPGVGRVPYGLGGLVLRGASPRDSRVVFDGIEVPMLYHFGGLASIMPATAIDSLEVVPGGVGAEHGRAIGGLVVATSRPGRADRWRLYSEASLLDAQVRADGPAAAGTWAIGLRRSYVDAILALALPDDGDFQLTLAPRYYDAQVRYDLEHDRDRFTAVLFGADDRLAFATGPGAGLDYQSSFVRAGLRWQRRLGTTILSAQPWIGIDRVSLAVDDQFVTRDALPAGLRLGGFHAFATGHLAAGLDLQGGRYGYDVNNAPPAMPGGPVIDRDQAAPIPRHGIDWHADTALWLEANRQWDGGMLSLTPGLRVERFGLTGDWVAEPRLTARHAIHPRFSFEESLGLYHQPPVPADLDPVSGNPALGNSQSIQASVGAEARLPWASTAKITTYYDDLSSLPADVVSGATAASTSGSPRSGGVASISRELTSEQFGTYSYQENVGRGRNYGVEVLLKRSTAHSLAWVAYTYGRALRRDDPRQRPEYLPYVLDQPHVLTALGSVSVGRWTFGARLRYATGNPFTPAVGAVMDPGGGKYAPIDGPILSERLPAFAQLDLRVDRTWVRPSGRWSAFLDLQNATNRLNPEGVSYSADYRTRSYTRGLPIFPSIGVSFQPGDTN